MDTTMLHYLLYLSSMIVLVTSIPFMPTTDTRESLTETADPHNEDTIDDACAEGNITIADENLMKTYELGELLGVYRPTFYSLDYGVNGSFYTIKDHPQKIFIGNFSYNGLAPLVYFYVGLTLSSGKNNFYVPSDYHTYDPCDIKDGFLIGIVHKHENQSVIINLPQDFTIHNIRWIMLWCRVFALDMGHVWNNHYNESSRKKRDTSNPETTDRLLLGSIAGRKYDVKGDVYAIDSTTLFLRNFSYNGMAPDAYFLAGYAEKIGVNGTKIPDENGSTKILEAYENQDITLKLPAGFTIKDFKWLSVFCDSFLQDFGHIRYDPLDFEEKLDSLDLQPIDTMTSENQTKTNVMGSNDESDVSEDLEDETVTVSAEDETVTVSAEDETVTVSAEDYGTKKELDVLLEPEPEPDNLLPRAEESESTGMAPSLTTTSEYIMAITIGLYFLLG